LYFYQFDNHKIFGFVVCFFIFVVYDLIYDILK